MMYVLWAKAALDRSHIMELEWITPLQASEKWEITERQVQAMCKSGKITGAIRLSKLWLIPKDEPRPIDGRTKQAKQQRNSNGE